MWDVTVSYVDALFFFHRAVGEGHVGQFVLEGVVDGALGLALQRLQFPGTSQRTVEEFILGGDPFLLLFPFPDLILQEIAVC